MSCDLNKTSTAYRKELETGNLEKIYECIQKSIDYKLNSLIQREEVNYIKNTKTDTLTFTSMNANTLTVYTNNFYYVIFKLFLFIIIIGSYFILSK